MPSKRSLMVQLLHLDELLRYRSFDEFPELRAGSGPAARPARTESLFLHRSFWNDVASGSRCYGLRRRLGAGGWEEDFAGASDLRPLKNNNRFRHRSIIVSKRSSTAKTSMNCSIVAISPFIKSLCSDGFESSLISASYSFWASRALRYIVIFSSSLFQLLQTFGGGNNASRSFFVTAHPSASV